MNACALSEYRRCSHLLLQSVLRHLLLSSSVSQSSRSSSSIFRHDCGGRIVYKLLLWCTPRCPRSVAVCGGVRQLLAPELLPARGVSWDEMLRGSGPGTIFEKLISRCPPPPFRLPWSCPRVYHQASRQPRTYAQRHSPAIWCVLCLFHGLGCQPVRCLRFLWLGKRRDGSSSPFVLQQEAQRGCQHVARINLVSERVHLGLPSFRIAPHSNNSST